MKFREKNSMVIISHNIGSRAKSYQQKNHSEQFSELLPDL
jgi:hypothetical protein